VGGGDSARKSITTTLLQILGHLSSLSAVEFLQETLASLNSILLLPHISNFSLGSGGEWQSKEGGGKKELNKRIATVSGHYIRNFRLYKTMNRIFINHI
jgi:hypothetical protein